MIHERSHNKINLIYMLIFKSILEVGSGPRRWYLKEIVFLGVFGGYRKTELKL